MDSGLIFLFFGGFFVLAAVLVVVGLVQAKKRREKLSAYAATRGWSYAARDDSLVHRFTGAPFGRGHDRRATNVLRGVWDGRPMVAFDYQYDETTGTGDDRRTTTYRFSVTVVNTGAAMPALSVTPQNIVSGFFGRLTNRDIELESEDFNRAFLVTCEHRKFASDVLHPRMMELLLGRPDLGWRFEADSMVSVRRGHHEPAEIEATLAHLDAVVDAIPEFVWREVRGQS